MTIWWPKVGNGTDKMGTTVKRPVELTFDEIDTLRISIKNNGLMGAIQQMNVEQRGLARRAVREGLSLLLDQRKREAEGVVQRKPEDTILELGGTKWAGP